MKRVLNLAIVIALASGMVACGGSGKGTQDNAEKMEHDNHEGHDHSNESAEKVDFVINTEASEVMWTGGMLKVGGSHLYSHSGTINVSGGKLVLQGKTPIVGKISIDMTSMLPTDENYGEDAGHTAKDLVAHLSAEDFFDVEKFPNALFNFNVEEGQPTVGKMTIKGVSKEEKIQIESVSTDGKTAKIQGAFTINRQDYGVAYDMGAEDKFISDEIDIKFVIAADIVE